MHGRTQPTARSQRLLAPDLARGVMLLLIAMAYAGVYVGAGFGADTAGAPLLDRLSSAAANLFLDNRAFPMFAILFGYGVAWSVGRRAARGAEPRDQRRRMRRRAVLLLAFGAVHAILLYPGEILTSYGFALLVTGWLLFRSDRALRAALVLSALFYAVTVPLIFLAASFAPEDSFGYQLPGYTSAADWTGRVLGVPFNPLYVAVAYPLLLLVLLGYWAGRARLFERTQERRTLLRLIAAAGVSVSVLGALPAALLGVLEVAPGPQGLLLALQVLTGIAGGAGYAALFALGAQKLQQLLPGPTRAVAAVGKRSLTFYILNSLLVTVVLHPELIGLGAHVGHFGALVTAALSWTVGVAVAAWLERGGRPGPLEQIMRRAVDGPDARTAAPAPGGRAAS